MTALQIAARDESMNNVLSHDIKHRVGIRVDVSLLGGRIPPLPIGATSSQGETNPRIGVVDLETIRSTPLWWCLVTFVVRSCHPFFSLRALSIDSA